MKFLAIDTSAKALTIVAVNGEKRVHFSEDCAMQHSVRLFPELDGVLARAELSLRDCEMIACVVGPGSFTGIRIGISAVKGLCFASAKPALALTSFDALAYADEREDKIAVVDAGHGFLYAEGYGAASLARGYYSSEEILSLMQKTGAPAVAGGAIGFPAECADAALGLERAASALFHRAGSAELLSALYLRRSNAEEGR